jgi:hypothetical protein
MGWVGQLAGLAGLDNHTWRGPLIATYTAGAHGQTPSQRGLLEQVSGPGGGESGGLCCPVAGDQVPPGVVGAGRSLACWRSWHQRHKRRP